MIRNVVLTLCALGCGRSHAPADQDLPGLVTELRPAEPTINVERAASDPAELGRALARRYGVMLAALGPHSAAVNSTTTVDEAGKRVSELSDHAQIDNGEAGVFRAVYTNSADYGRETTYVGGKLYLRPRYQRWHVRGPETADEPEALRDQYFDAIGAAWELLAPGAALVDRGPLEMHGRAARKIEVVLSQSPAKPAAEPVTQRKWREGRSVDVLAGEIVLDADKGVPLAVKLSGTIGFSRDGRRFAMAVAVDSSLSGLGVPATIVAPPDGDIVATPERMREVDERDYLLQGIAPPLRRNADGTAVPPAPVAPDGSKPPEQGTDKATSTEGTTRGARPIKVDKPSKPSKSNKRDNPDGAKP